MSDSKLIKFEIVTPERVVLKETIRQITLPTKQGEITVLPNHIPLIATLLPGVIHLRKSDDTPEVLYRDWETDRKSTRLNSSHSAKSRMPSSA